MHEQKQQRNSQQVLNIHPFIYLLKDDKKHEPVRVSRFGASGLCAWMFGFPCNLFSWGWASHLALGLEKDASDLALFVLVSKTAQYKILIAKCFLGVGNLVILKLPSTLQGSLRFLATSPTCLFFALASSP